MVNILRPYLQDNRIVYMIGLAIFIISISSFISPFIPIAFIGLAIVLLILKDYRFGTLLIIVFGFTQMAAQKFLSPFHLLLFVILITLISFALSVLQGKVKIRGVKDLNLLFIIFASWAFTSGILAVNHDFWISEVESMVRALIIFYLIYNSFSTKEEILVVFKVVVLSIFISSFISFFINFGVTSLSINNLIQIFMHRFAGTIFDPNYFAMAVAVSLPLAVVIIMKEKFFVFKALWICMVLFLLFSIAISQSRTGIFSISVIFLYTLYHLGKKKKKTAVFALLLPIIALIILLPSVFWYRFSIFWQSVTTGMRGDISMIHRLILVKAAFVTFIKNPIFGVGLNNFWAVAARYIQYPMVCHNTYLEIASNLGLLGFIPYLLILFKGFNMPRRALHNPDLSEEAWAVRAGLLGCCVAMLFLSVAFKLDLWILLALSATLYKLAKRSDV